MELQIGILATIFSKLPSSVASGGSPSFNPGVHLGERAFESQRGRRRGRRPILKAAFAAFASLTAAVFIIAVCRFFLKDQAGSLIGSRRLSTDGYPSDHELLQICEDTGDGSDDFGRGESPPAPDQQRTSVKSAKRARMDPDTGHSEEDYASDTETHDDEPSTSTGRGRRRRAPALQSLPLPGAQVKEASDDEGPQATGLSPELEAAQALLQLHDIAARVSGTPATHSDSPLPPTRPVSADGSVIEVLSGASPSYSPQMTAHQLSELLLQPQSLSQTSRSPEESFNSDASNEAGASSGEFGGSSDTGQPGTSAAGVAAFREHAFYRTPTVLPQYRDLKLFNPEATRSFGLAFTQPLRRLLDLRKKLSQDTLSPAQLSELADRSTELLAYLYHYEDYPAMDRRNHLAVRTLGMRYLILDAIVCALQVLGVPIEGPWWNAITRRIPDEAAKLSGFRPYPRQRAQTFHHELLRKLVAALQTLKTGNRLSRDETIALKRMLFCSEFSPANFKRPRWNPWRQDDKDFTGESLAGRLA
ncbi:hypothetical protein Efla_007751 [Eimeria flavescens]